jgi:hypothetical protein
MLTVGREVGRLTAAAGLAIAMSACSVALVDPPRAMYGTSAWSDAWQVTCGVDPWGTKPEKLGAEHVDNDRHQYEVALQMRDREPRVAGSSRTRSSGKWSLSTPAGTAAATARLLQRFIALALGRRI